MAGDQYPPMDSRQLIVDRARRPRHGGVLEPADATASAHNPSCGDLVTLTLRLSSDLQLLETVCCSTRGCVLCTASADLMAEVVSGRTSAQALGLGKGFVSLLKGEPSEAAADPALAALRPLAGLPARARCALLPWQALAEALELDSENTQL
jgi:nitrogen fixation protein NifU and related proteins